MIVELMNLVPRPTGTNLTEELTRLLERHAVEPSRRRPARAAPCSAAEYVGDLLGELEAYFAEHAAATEESWSQYLGLSRREDIETVVIPRLLRSLTRLAQTGETRWNYDILTQILYLLMREMLRAGELPCYFPLALLPSIPEMGEEPKASF